MVCAPGHSLTMPVPVSKQGGAPRRSLQEMLLQPECDMRCPSQPCPVAISPSAGGRVKFKLHSVHTPLLLLNPWSSSWAGHSGLQGLEELSSGGRARLRCTRDPQKGEKQNNVLKTEPRPE